jgi:hypothetical protein
LTSTAASTTTTTTTIIITPIMIMNIIKIKIQSNNINYNINHKMWWPGYVLEDWVLLPADDNELFLLNSVPIDCAALSTFLAMGIGGSFPSGEVATARRLRMRGAIQLHQHSCVLHTVVLNWAQGQLHVCTSSSNSSSSSSSIKTAFIHSAVNPPPPQQCLRNIFFRVK